MKQNLLIKLNDVIIGISENYDRAIKKSLEFFMGTIIDEKDIREFREKKCPANNHDCIMAFLNEKNIFLRDKAIIKKFTEYYLGKEFNGLISDSQLLISKKKLEDISLKYNLFLLALMPNEEADFLISKFKLEKFNPIIANSAKEGIKKAKAELYLGNAITDYNAAIEENVSFIGLNMNEKEITKGKVIKNIGEL